MPYAVDIPKGLSILAFADPDADPGDPDSGRPSSPVWIYGVEISEG